MIRRLEERDREWVKSQGRDWEFGHDFAGGLVYVDAQDKPVIAAGTWRRAETHIACDSDWSTPGAREAALKEIHEAMRQELQSQRVGEAITFFDRVEESDKSFFRRLQRWGWQKIERQMWGRVI